MTQTNSTASTPETTYKYKYTISYSAVRDVSETNTVVINSDTASNASNATVRPQATFVKNQNHSAPITGTFQLSYGGSVLTNANGSNFIININQPDTYKDLELRLKSQFGKYIEVDTYQKRGFYPVWIIYFYGLKGDVPLMTTTASLTGGASGVPASPSAKVSTIR